MMAYDDLFVLAIIQGGSPIREVSGKAHLPFHSEYKIRLKNKHSNLRAQARVWIDGRKVSNLGDFILQPGQTLDLERFLDQSMETGNKFKFVPLSDTKVNDPTDEENGIIKVEFYREKVIPISWNWDNNLFANTKQGNWSNNSWNIQSYFSVNTTNTANIFGNPIARGSANHLSSPGATVEGASSNQKFSVGEFFITESEPVTLTLQLRGINEMNYKTPEVMVTNAQQEKERYCGGCGKRRHKMSDKFCPRCGNKYNTIR